MKKLILITLGILSSLMLYNCDDDMIRYSDDTGEVNSMIKNNRLFFNTKNDLIEFHDKLKSKNEDEIVSLFEEKFYSKGFYSLKPIVNKETEKYEIDRHLNNFLQKHPSRSLYRNDYLEDFDDLE